jgi:HSP20 family molecular chaperone IbpA
MAEKQNVQTRGATEAQRQESGTERVLRPPVDICENAEGITLEADVPGMSKDRLNIQVDRDMLLIEGDISVEVPEGMKALYADVHATRYRRSFTLSRELETDKLAANLKDGVLRIQIPKRAEVRPRRIEVQAG